MPRQISCQPARKPDSKPGMITGVLSAIQSWRDAESEEAQEHANSSSLALHA